MEISGIELTETFLTFLNDILVEIHTDYKSAITEAFKLKYGDPELTKNDKTTECTLKTTGKTVSYTETIYYQNWTNDDIICIAGIGEYRDRNCEKQLLSYIVLNTEESTRILAGCDIDEKEQLKARQDAAKKKQLDDF